MKSQLAFTLIGQLLKWDDAKFAEEFRELQLMISHKYDEYQGFEPATRFHVALLNWLSQFPDIEKRLTAYQIVKDRLIFISQREMNHLVSLFMPIAERMARKKVAYELGIPFYETWSDEQAIGRLKALERRTLYVGLSDGAKMDVFRRYNEGTVSNEQVVAFSEIGDDKWKDLQNELQKDMCRSGPPDKRDATFEIVCLIDDFSGSGASLIRYDDKELKWKGKVAKFHKANRFRKDTFLSANCRIHVHHHLASSKASKQIEADLKKFKVDNPEFEYTSSFSYVLPDDIVINENDSDKKLVALLQDWYDKGIEDEHTKSDIWFGYKQCGLPLILEHNTPNNSLALLWASSSKDDAKPFMKPLFSRRKRHSSHG
ncbi:phosphoribosyltransferase-like protein [Stenotrophobium rhamnosiphilum]|uniref:PRTase-CE domain-containing protein n=1 Tax=Stenotrophobium rhamnosiphilum TaxID=2029166 RepID=A0A2T5MCL8_9GAMM|nr:hypothetical protein [Stenotrophobium rhamnosiphilum]PTU30324.1 hypothetical protein CJD38_15370 [Stenotrophobium rhamnosiphilum]